ncbi:CPBP family intramembrane glutamic endopeptidase [Erysipelothrix sp. P66]|uniref:CPBP family intramembrane glutamic endopeptidase n=1 Tax=Erysipelothrix sp. P66 TaxID=3141531 RepID=UPI00315D18AC
MSMDYREDIFYGETVNHEVGIGDIESPLKGKRLFWSVLSIFILSTFSDAFVGVFIEMKMVQEINMTAFTPIVMMLLTTVILLWINLPLIKEARTLPNPLTRIHILRKVGFYFVVMVFANFIVSPLVAILIETLGGSSQPINQEALIAMKGIGFPMYFVFAVVAGPIKEELLFRGLIFRKLIHKNRFAAYVVSSILFGLMHLTTELVTGQWVMMFNLIIYAGMGAFFAYIYEKTNSIKAAMYLHMIWNTLGVVAIFAV